MQEKETVKSRIGPARSSPSLRASSPVDGLLRLQFYRLVVPAVTLGVAVAIGVLRRLRVLVAVLGQVRQAETRGLLLVVGSHQALAVTGVAAYAVAVPHASPRFHAHPGLDARDHVGSR